MPLNKAHSDKPLVSIITPVLNAEKFIADNIESVLNQTYPYIEHIVIDGKSMDMTIPIVRELNPEAIVLSEPDSGATDAINKGLRISSGDIIAILNYDDYYAHKNVIQRVVDLFVSNLLLRVVYGKVRSIEVKTGKTVFIHGKPFFQNSKNSNLAIYKRIIEGNAMPYPATFAKREVYDNIGLFSLEYEVCSDYEYYLRVIRLYEPFFFNEIITIMRRGGFSDRNIYRGHREVYRLLVKNGVGRINAAINLAHRYMMTFLSLLLQKIGLDWPVLFYRKMKGRL